MLTATFLLASVIQLAIFVLIFRLYKENLSIYTAIAMITVFGIFYDNFIISIGQFIGEGDFLYQLNAVRFVVHGIVTPLMIMFGWGMAVGYELSWHKKQWIFWGFAGLTAVFVALGFYEEVITLSLAPEWDGEILRYTHTVSSGPPLASIVVIIVNIVVGGFLWRQKGQSALCICSILMFIFAGAGASILVLSNIGEVFFAAGVYITDRNLQAQNDVAVAEPNLQPS